MRTANFYEEDCIRFTVFYHENDITFEEWQELVYKCFEYNMKVDCFYNINVFKTRRDEPVLELFVKDEFTEVLDEIVYFAGIEDFYMSSEKVALFEDCDLGCKCVAME